jgi:hypothetical protein
VWKFGDLLKFGVVGSNEATNKLKLVRRGENKSVSLENPIIDGHVDTKQQC